MLLNILQKAEKITGGEDGWVSLRHSNKNKSRKAFLADEIILLTREKKINWSNSVNKEIFYSDRKETIFLIIMRAGNINAASRSSVGIVDRYSLLIFQEEKEIMCFTETCDNIVYDNHSRRLPIMDLYDTVAMGNFRKPITAHVCGLSGFGAPGDVCEACENSEEKRKANRK